MRHYSTFYGHTLLYAHISETHTRHGMFELDYCGVVLLGPKSKCLTHGDLESLSY
jgi:hypothetical protein